MSIKVFVLYDLNFDIVFIALMKCSMSFSHCFIPYVAALQGRWLPRMLKVTGSIPGRGCTDLYRARRRSGGTAHEGGGDESRQLDNPYLTTLSGADCGRLQQ